MPGPTDSPGPPSSPGPPGRRRLGLLLAIAVGVYVADVVSKVIVVATLSHRPPLHVIDGPMLNAAPLLRSTSSVSTPGTNLISRWDSVATTMIFETTSAT